MEEEEEGANIWHQSTEEEDEVGRPLWKLGIPYGGERRERGPLGTKKGKGGGVIKGLEEGGRDSTNIAIRLFFRFRKTQRSFKAFLM